MSDGRELEQCQHCPPYDCDVRKCTYRHVLLLDEQVNRCCPSIAEEISAQNCDLLSGFKIWQLNALGLDESISTVIQISFANMVSTHPGTHQRTEGIVAQRAAFCDIWLRGQT